MKKLDQARLFAWMVKPDIDVIRFAGKTKPAREGWYYCEYKEGYKGFYRFFDNNWWLDQSTCTYLIELAPCDTPIYWFGLTKHYENYR